MGSYVFRWPHPASEVFVTGTFDDWGKTVRLDKKGDLYEKLVHLPETAKNIYYKFVVDGVWTTDHNAPQEHDGYNNLNNVLTPEQMDRSQQPQTSASSLISSVISSVTPQSTTAGLAKDVPLESKDETEHGRMPGEFPMTPAQERSEFKSEPQTLDLPGGFPSTPGQERSEPTAKPETQPSSSTEGSERPADATDQDQPAQEEGAPHADQDVQAAESADDRRQQEMGTTQDNENVQPGQRTDDSTAKGSSTPRDNERSQSAQESGVPSGAEKDSPSNNEKTQSSPKTEDSEPRFGVSPLPATAGIGNPIQLKHGADVPDPRSFTSNTVNSNITLDKESYERGGSASSGFPMLPPVVTPQDERDRKGTGVLDLPPITKNLIPESSLPMGDDTRSEKDPGAFISSAGPSTSTAELASKVPLEPRRSSPDVPEIVKESQHEAHVEPEASASAEVVEEKRAVEEELTREVKPTPPTTEGTGRGDGAPSTNESEVTPAYRGIPPSVMQSIQEMNLNADRTGTAIMPRTTSGLGQDSPIDNESGPTAADEGHPGSRMQSTQGPNSSEVDTTAPGVPEVVAKSLNQAQQSPEAAANYEAVAEKRAVEEELLEEVKPAESAGQPAPTLSAALSGSAPRPTPETKPEVSEAETAYRVDQPGPEFRATEPTFTEQEQGTSEPTFGQAGLAAPATAPAVTPTTGEASRTMIQQQDIASSSTESPPRPIVTTGVNAGPTETNTPQKTTTPATSSASTPQSGHVATESPGSSTSKKDKRRSGFFGKLKEKLRR